MASQRSVVPVEGVDAGMVTAVDAHLDSAMASVEGAASALLAEQPQLSMLTRVGAKAERAALLAGVGATTAAVAAAPALPGRGRGALESHAIRQALVGAVQECATRLPLGAALPRLLAAGDRLRAVGELEAAESLCYGPSRLAFVESAGATAAKMSADYIVRLGGGANNDVWQAITRTKSSASTSLKYDDDEEEEEEEYGTASFGESSKFGGSGGGSGGTEKLAPALTREVIVVDGADDEQLTLYACAVYGEALCKFGIAVRCDPHFVHMCTVTAAVAAMSAVQRAMGAVLKVAPARREALYWLLVNGSVHLHAMSTPLARCGFGKHSVTFLSWCVAALEHVVNICSARFLRWRLELYRSLAGGFMIVGDTRRAAAAAARAAQQVDELWSCEALQVPIPNETLRTLRQGGTATRRLRFVTRLRLQPPVAGPGGDEADDAPSAAAEAAAVDRLLALVRAYRAEPLLQLELIGDALAAAPAGVAIDPACRARGDGVAAVAQSTSRAAWGITGERELTDVVIDSSPLERDTDPASSGTGASGDDLGRASAADELAELRDVHRLLTCVAHILRESGPTADAADEGEGVADKDAEDDDGAAATSPLDGCFDALLRMVDQYRRDLLRAERLSAGGRGTSTPRHGSSSPGSVGGSPRSQQQMKDEAMLNAALVRGGNALTTLVVAARVCVKLLGNAVQFHHAASAQQLAPTALLLTRRLKKWHEEEDAPAPALRSATGSPRAGVSRSAASSPRSTSLAVRTQSSGGAGDFIDGATSARDNSLARHLLLLDAGGDEVEALSEGRSFADLDVGAQLDVDGSAARASLPSVAHRAAAARTKLRQLETRLETMEDEDARLDALIAAAAEQGKLREKKGALALVVAQVRGAIKAVRAEHASLTSMIAMTSAEARLLEHKARLLEAMSGIGAALRATALRQRLAALRQLAEDDAVRPSEKEFASLDARLDALEDAAHEATVRGVPRIERLPCKWLEIGAEVLLHLCNSGASAVDDAGTAIAVATTELGGLLAACACRIWRPYCEALIRAVDSLTTAQTAGIVAAASMANPSAAPGREVNAAYLVGLLQRCLLAVHVAANGNASPAAAVIDDPVLAATVALRLGRLFAADGLGSSTVDEGMSAEQQELSRVGGQAAHPNAPISSGGVGCGARPEYRMAIQTLQVGLRRLSNARAERISFDANAPPCEADIAALARSAITALPVLKAELDEEERFSSPSEGNAQRASAASAARPGTAGSTRPTSPQQRAERSAREPSFGRGSKLDAIDGSLACLHVELERALIRAELRRAQVLQVDSEYAKARRQKLKRVADREREQLFGGKPSAKGKKGKDGSAPSVRSKRTVASRAKSSAVAGSQLVQQTVKHDAVSLCEKRLAQACGANSLLRAVLHMERALLEAGGGGNSDGGDSDSSVQLDASVKCLVQATREARILYGAAPPIPSRALSGQAAAAQRTIREQRVASAVETALKEKKRRRFRRHAKPASLVAPPPPAFLSRSSTSVTLRVEYPTWAAARACVLMSTQDAQLIDGSKVQQQTMEAPVVRLALFGKEVQARDLQSMGASGRGGSTAAAAGAGAAVVAATGEEDAAERRLAALSSSVSEAGGALNATKHHVGSVAGGAEGKHGEAKEGAHDSDAHGVSVNAQNVLLSGTGVPLVMGSARKTSIGVVVTVHGLEPNKQYVFAAAVVADLTTMVVSEDVLSAHTVVGGGRESLHLLSPIGEATPMISTALPLPIMALWGHLARAADRCGVTCHPQLHSATEALHRHFVQHRSALPGGVQRVLSPADELAIRQSRLLSTPPAVLRLFHAATVMLVNARDDDIIAMAEGDDSDSEDDAEQRAFTSLIGSQRLLLDCVGQILVAVQVAVALEDAQLVANTVARAYVLMLPLLRLRNTGRWMMRPLTILFTAVHRVCAPVGGKTASGNSAGYRLNGGSHGTVNVIAATKSGFDIDHATVQRVMLRTAGMLVREYTRCDERDALTALLPAIRTWCAKGSSKQLSAAAAAGGEVAAIPLVLEDGPDTAEAERRALWAELASVGAGNDSATADEVEFDAEASEIDDGAAAPLVSAAAQAGAADDARALDGLASSLWASLRTDPRVAMAAIDRATAVAQDKRNKWLAAKAKLALALHKEASAAIKAVGVVAAKGAKAQVDADATDAVEAAAEAANPTDEGDEGGDGVFDEDEASWTVAQVAAADTARALAEAEEAHKAEKRLLELLGPEPKGADIAWRLRWLCRIGAAINDSTATFDDAQPALLLSAQMASAPGGDHLLRAECRAWVERERVRYFANGHPTSIDMAGVPSIGALPGLGDGDSAADAADDAVASDGDETSSLEVDAAALAADVDAELDASEGSLVARLGGISAAVLAAEDGEAWMTRVDSFDPLAFTRAAPRFDNDPLEGHFVPHGLNDAARQRAEGGLAALRAGAGAAPRPTRDELVWLAQLELLSGVASARDVYALSQQATFVAPALAAGAPGEDKVGAGTDRAATFAAAYKAETGEPREINAGVIVGPELPLDWMPPIDSNKATSVASCLSALSLDVRGSLEMMGNADADASAESGALDSGAAHADGVERTAEEKAGIELREACSVLSAGVMAGELDTANEIAKRLCLSLDRMSRSAWRACWGEGWGVVRAAVAQMWNALTRVGALPMLARSLRADAPHFWRPLLRASHSVIDMLDSLAREQTRSEEIANEMRDGAFGGLDEERAATGDAGSDANAVDAADTDGALTAIAEDDVADATMQAFDQSVFDQTAAGGQYGDAQHLELLLDLGSGQLLYEARAGVDNEQTVGEVALTLGGPELLPALVRFVRFTMQALLCAEQWSSAVKLGVRMLSQCHRLARTEEIVLPLLAVAQRNVRAQALKAQAAGQATVTRHDERRPASPKLSRRLRLAQSKQLVKVAKKLTPEQQVWKTQRDGLTDTLELLEIEVARQESVVAVFDGMEEDAKRDKSIALAAVHETLALCRAAHLGGDDSKLKTIEAATHLRRTIALLRQKQEVGLLAEMLHEQVRLFLLLLFCSFGSC